jgi:hypothetical protein
MGVDLVGIGRSYNWHGWCDLYDLGVAFGWRPAGALMPLDPMARDGHDYPDDDYPGERVGYFTNDEQWVTNPDAAAWATALYRALSSEENKNAARNILDLTDREVEEWVRDFADAISRRGFCII